MYKRNEVFSIILHPPLGCGDGEEDDWIWKKISL